MSSTKAVLEKRIDFMAGFILAVRTGGISRNWIDYFQERDRHFIYEFCEKVGEEPWRIYNSV